ncbi:MBL fold metallo-hydrolase [Haloarchaeobius iranensis]|uniref:Putative mRNA 3-end processing factor n=1 Tax=Haloarchaeobius iranensis TaxID=996166 RepID=A0A1H0BNL7_9EURY|nr:MBL fold metallo-hydrolase [Haloarchaeobius iranensis]SDN47257.1 putative mRNA 3-end processing factor [Haloarchaeobius iranensis]
MEVTFQHANPHSGHESVLVRLSGDVTDQTACILFDSGTDVDVDGLLEDDEYLTAIVLTHAHLDHYATLGTNLRDGAPVYTSEPTAAILDTVLTEAATNYDISNVDAVVDALEPISDWTTVLGDIELRPVPAGHTPGAAGFPLRFDDGGEHRTMLVTGDWTQRSAAGFSGLPTTLSPDAVFLTGATNEEFESELTAAVETILERVRAGSTVLVTASGLAGVHIAALLAELDTIDIDPPSVSITGHAAKLYETLGYDYSTVTSVPTFDDADVILEPGAVTIAGPEVPVEGSAAKFYDCVQDDPGATLVQLTSGSVSPVESAGCTVDCFQYSNHPPEAAVDDLVEDLAPRQVVMMHQSGAALSRYKDRYDSFVWATTDRDEYRIYEDGTWVAPPWVNDRVARRLRSQQYGNGSSLGSFIDSERSLANVEQSEISLEAEGLDVSSLRTQFRQSAPELSKSKSASQYTDSPVEGEDTDILEHVDEIKSRLSRVEEALTDRDDAGYGTHQVRVVDAGDGCLFLRLCNTDDVDQSLTHGDTVTIRLQNTPD